MSEQNELKLGMTPKEVKERIMNKTNVLDQLRDMDLQKDKLPLIIFLNLTEEYLEKAYKTSELKLDYSLDDIKSFYKEISFVLDSLSEGKNTEAIEHLLTEKLAKARHYVEVDGKRAFMHVSLNSGTTLDKFWIDFLFTFLSSKWDVRMTRCSVCGNWFYRAKGDKIYCSKSCKNKSDYDKHRERRVKRRRERYHRDRSVNL